MSLPNKPRGTQDIYPPRSLLYQKVQQIIFKILSQNNYQPIIFPTFEAEELFTNSLGSTTDIIHKEMYNFTDRKGRKMVLRPEGTASVVRLVYQNGLIRTGYSLKFYYWANMFRYERPQKGRYREFWQLGVELINATGILADYQILKLVNDILNSLGIKNFTFHLNYLGSNETKKKYQQELTNFIEKNKPFLCSDCQRRYQTNPLRMLDCPDCRNKNTYPLYKNSWTEKNNHYVKELSQLLDKFNFPYQYDYHLVRGLDYYTGLVFEVSLANEKALLGGGRYDQLYQDLTDLSVPAAGFAVGIDRLLDYLETVSPNSELLKSTNQIDIFFGVAVPEIYEEVLVWVEKLIQCSLIVDYNLETKKIKDLIKIIDYYQPKLAIILGNNELKNQKILVKDWLAKKEFWVEKEKLTEWIYGYLQKNKWIKN